MTTKTFSPSSASRWDACPGRPRHPRIAIMGRQANWPNIQRVLNLPGTWLVWQRHITMVYVGYCLEELRGLRGPGQVWWVDWDATHEMVDFAEVHEFKKATIEECRDVIAAILKG